MGAGAVSVARADDAAGVRAFVAVPFRLFGDGRHAPWVPPLRAAVRDALDDRRHPFYRHATRALFVARRGARVVGRIAAIENRAANAHAGDRLGYFGFFECDDDSAAAAALFDAARDWLRRRGLAGMLGPVNPSTNYDCGVLVDGHDRRPAFLTPWNPTYYPALFEGAGARPAKDLLGLWFPIQEPGWALPPAVDQLTARATGRSGVRVRPLDLARFDGEVATCAALYNAAWHDNWGFVPMPADEFAHMAKDLRLLMRPDLSFIAEVDGAPAGFLFALPDYNDVLRHNRSGRLLPGGLPRMLWYKSRMRAARVLALGVRPEFRARGILPLFTAAIVRRGYEIGAEGAEASWLLEDNHLIVKPLRMMGARDRMRWRLYTWDADA
jgi:GNAT superfamily N-acetyltransferase